MMRRVLSLALMLLALTGCSQRAREVRAHILKEDVHTDSIVVKVIAAGVTENVGMTNYVGTVSSSRSAVVSSLNSGTLKNFRLKEGDHVAAGQVIGLVESQGVRSAHEAARAALNQAEDGWERIGKVQKSGSVATVKVVEVQTKLEQARASELAARTAVSNMTLRAPFSGVVEHVFASDGEELGIADPLVRIVDASSVEIHFPLPENEFLEVREGDKATVVVPAIGKTLTATVASKGVVASSLSHSYDCVLTLDGREPLAMPGMVCKVYMHSGGGAAIVIPSGAVMTDMEGRYVWTATGGIVGKRYVVIDGYSGDGVVVREGLGEGDLVIVEGSRKVSTGMAVKTVR